MDPQDGTPFDCPDPPTQCPHCKKWFDLGTGEPIPATLPGEGGEAMTLEDVAEVHGVIVRKPYANVADPVVVTRWPPAKVEAIKAAASRGLEAGWLREQVQRALAHFDMRSELYTNDADVAAGMADILRLALIAGTQALPLAPALPGKWGEACAECGLPEDVHSNGEDGFGMHRYAPASVGGERKSVGPCPHCGCGWGEIHAPECGEPRSKSPSPDIEGLVERLRSELPNWALSHEAATALEAQHREIKHLDKLIKSAWAETIAVRKELEK